MKESEYINTTDLAKLRAAYSILGDVFPGVNGRHIDIMRQLSKSIDEAYVKLEVEEDE